MPVKGAAPSEPSIRPRPQAASPFQGLAPVSIPTMVRASTTNIICSPNPTARIIGIAKKIATERTRAPNTPPNIEEMNAADRALAPSPLLASGNPSKTVAWEPDVPGMPIKTEGKVSEVVVTDWRPIIIASARLGSMPNTNGNNSANPAVPPRPGRMPTIRPITTPKKRCSI